MTAELETKLDAISAQVGVLLERRRRRDELLDELSPILKDVMAAATIQFAALEDRGYFAFGKELVRVLDNVVQGYSPDDVAALATSVVSILDTVRSLTQPHVLKVMSEAGGLVERADEEKPVGLLGTVRATRDEDVQRGMAVMLEVLRAVGRGADRADRRARLRQHLAPRHTRVAAVVTERAGAATRRRPPVPRASVKPVGGATADAPTGTVQPSRRVVPIAVEGVDLTDEGFLVDAGQWTPEIAATIAQQVGIDTLTEQHFALFDAIRADFRETGASPNIRRMTKVSNISTKDIYALFPHSPGKTAARIAGLPKPVGCI